MNKEILNKELWAILQLAIQLKLALKFNQKHTRTVQVWTLIPPDMRKLIKYQDLTASIFPRLRNLIGLDYDLENPIMADGDFWLLRIKQMIESKRFNDKRNIFIFDKKLSIILFILSEGGILLYNEGFDIFKATRSQL